MAELFRGLITDEGINKARDLVATGGWKIAPFQFSLTDSTVGEFSTTRTTTSMKSTYYSNYFSSIEKIDNNKILLAIELDGNDAVAQRYITEIYITATTTSGSQPFLYSLIQPISEMRFPTQGSTLKMSFILTLTNTQKNDIYTIEQVDENKFSNYQLRKEKGQPSGYAPLGAEGVVPDQYLPLRDNLPIGTILPIVCSSNYSPTGYLPCDGTEYSRNQFITDNPDSSYRSFFDDYLVTGLVATCTYLQWQNDVNTYGSCGKFAIDLVNQKFKTPLIKNGTHIQQALSDGELSKLYKAGLPNITGTFSMETGSNPALSGAFYADRSISNNSGKPDGTSDPLITFDASHSNAIYGGSNTVQTDSVALRYFVIVAHGLIHSTVVDFETLMKQIKANTDGVSQLQSNSVFAPDWDKKVYRGKNYTLEEDCWVYLIATVGWAATSSSSKAEDVCIGGGLGRGDSSMRVGGIWIGTVGENISGSFDIYTVPFKGRGA